MPHSTTTSTDTTSSSLPTTTINNTSIPFAPLQILSYAKLLAKDPTESQRLLFACQNPGFFHLDFNNEAGHPILADLQQVYSASNEHYSHPPPGHEKDPSWRADVGNGNFEIPYDELTTNKFTLPTTLSPHRPLLHSFASKTHAINLHLLSLLSSSLNHDFSTHHSPSSPSESAFNLIHAPSLPLRSSCPDTTHTDSGTLTILFCEDWGIMLEDPSSKEWGYVEPKKGTGLVNVGDALEKMSGEVLKGGGGGSGEKALHSCRHAVAQVGDGVKRRNFVVDYLRPEKGF